MIEMLGDTVCVLHIQFCPKIQINLNGSKCTKSDMTYVEHDLQDDQGLYTNYIL